LQGLKDCPPGPSGAAEWGMTTTTMEPDLLTGNVACVCRSPCTLTRKIPVVKSHVSSEPLHFP
ncbi:MAG: hypothetical protein VX470_08415, partial [Planctomycetota bacterium]|nr:hypothetical protein [Planctomycetota bacterium]